MITNSEIADILSLHAKLLEINDKDERRYKTFSNAAFVLERLEGNVYEMSSQQILSIQGIGKMLEKAISDIVSFGTFEEFEDIRTTTPIGVVEMFRVKGLGVKKIKQLWQALAIDSIEKLKKACQEGIISSLKGFGEKTQDKILDSISFIESQRGKLRLNKGILLAEEVRDILSTEFEKVEIVGQVRQANEVIDKITMLIATESKFVDIKNPLFIKDWTQSSPFKWFGFFDENETPIEVHFVAEDKYSLNKLLLSSEEAHLQHELNGSFIHFLSNNKIESEQDGYEKFGLPYIVPEMRVGRTEFEWAKKYSSQDLITYDSLKGILHNHSTYSDGKHSLRQMAEYCKSLGFEYLGIADHSQTASYAQGLPLQKVLQQHQEIELLNEELGPFKILKGIESDILLDGSLDYEEEILSKFDFVVASVHQTLTMDIVKATDRLIKAIANPYTTILGHPTGRLLLAREGYPIDHKAIIDACAKYNVVMEINASPYRLDIDWRWIPYCMEKGVKLSINPDAHSMEGYHDMEYGVRVARKGGLIKGHTFNAFTLEEIKTHLTAKSLRA